MGAAPGSASTLNLGPNPSNRLNRLEGSMESTAKAIPDFDTATIRSLFAQTRASEQGCWEWVGYRDPDGYGVAKVNGERYRAHRVFYSVFVGPLEPLLVIDHLCRNTSCVNPRHLEQVTARTNTLRGSSPVASNPLVTQCPQGHDYTSENTYKDSRGSRHCIACSRERTREWRSRRTKRVRTHCKNGHEWVDSNIRVEKSGVRRCRPCHEEYEAKRKIKRSSSARKESTDTPEELHECDSIV